jgi:hypothetical protein
LARAHALGQVGDRHRVDLPGEQPVPRVATEARQVAATAASGEEAVGEATTAHAVAQPVSRVAVASAAAAWGGLVRLSDLPPRLSCHHT